MDVPELLTAMASVAATVPGLKSAHYPAANYINDAELPALVLYWGGPDETRIEFSNASGGDLWLPAVMGQLLVARLGNTPQEVAAVDALIHPLVDAFNRPIAEIPELAGKVHRCRVSRLRSMISVRYAEHDYAAAEFYFDVKMHRSNAL